MDRPKITIVTPNYNQAEFLEQTILSVTEQQYPDLEYIIIDGGSTDGSIEIIKKYEKHLAYWISEPDEGLYHALQKGFDKASGEVLGWINSDDMLHPGSLSVIGEIFSSFEKIRWITGCPSALDEKGRTVAVADGKQWSKYNFYLYDYRWIQQESTFWRRSLWQQAGSQLNLQIKYAADFELWLRFFRYEKLFTVHTIFGGFRFRSSGQLSFAHREKYLKEAEQLIGEELLSLHGDEKKCVEKLQRRLRIADRMGKFWPFNRLRLNALVMSAIKDAPTFIDFDHVSLKFKIGG
ncbi:MAG TPA: glycosyltransferase family 2 protein [Puia sp.]|nr:glycosyltransferase family 2 protein [Puia sp.]